MGKASVEDAEVELVHPFVLPAQRTWSVFVEMCGDVKCGHGKVSGAGGQSCG